MATRENIVTDGLVFSIDAGNKLGDNVSFSKNLVDPSLGGAFLNGLTVVDGEYIFDGVDMGIDFDGLTNIGGATEATFEVWIKRALSTDTLAFVMTATTETNIAGMYILGNVLYADIRNGSKGVYGHALTFDTDWHLLTVTYVGGVEMITYINGVNVAGSTDTIRPSLHANVSTIFEFGDYDPNGGVTTNATISNARVYNKALTAEEVSKNYESQKHRFH